MVKWTAVAFVFALLGIAAIPARAQTTQPASDPKLELRALEAFNAGNYVAALPLLQKVAVQYKDDKDRVDPILEKIRVCEKNLSSAELARINGVVPTGESRKPHPAPKTSEVYETTIKDLGNFDYDADEGGNVPDDVVKLDGAQIRLSGFMIPMDQAENITQFALVPSLFACCFGQPPQVQHTIIVNCPKGKAVSYYPDEIVVEGTLNVEEKKDEGFIVSLFEVEVSSVKPSMK